MRTRRKWNPDAVGLIAAVWFVVGLIAFVTVALVTPRHSLAVRITGLVWCLPLFAGAGVFMWTLIPEIFDVRPRFWPLWRRVREPVKEDLRSRE